MSLDEELREFSKLPEKLQKVFIEYSLLEPEIENCKQLICLVCGQEWDLTDSYFKENPFENCECGGMDFVNKSKHSLIGIDFLRVIYQIH